MLANILILIVGLLHFYFLYLEMFLWQTPRAERIFRLSPQDLKTTATLAANQGLYNGFLAAGLLWSHFIEKHANTTFYFLACVIVAGLYGAFKVNKRIFFVQSFPAILALIALIGSL